jgi:hypothetical protein
MEERLPTAREDEPQVPGRSGPHDVSVRDASWSEVHRSALRLEPLLPHSDLVHALEHVEQLILTLVHMRRGTGPLRRRHLHQPEGAVCLVTRCLQGVQLVKEADGIAGVAIQPERVLRQGIPDLIT